MIRLSHGRKLSCLQNFLGKTKCPHHNIKFCTQQIHQFSHRNLSSSTLAGTSQRFNNTILPSSSSIQNVHQICFRGLSNALSGEEHIKSILEKKFSSGTTIEVNDISGGCGDMYEIYIESADFAGIRTIKQHRMVTQILKTEIANMHGLRIFTSVPS